LLTEVQASEVQLDIPAKLDFDQRLARPAGGLDRLDAMDVADRLLDRPIRGMA